MAVGSAASILRSKHFCILPWIFAQVGQDRTVRPCCSMDGDFTYGLLKDNNFDQVWNGPPVRELRSRLLEDRPFEGCSACYAVESGGGRSFRQEVNEEFLDEAGRLVATAPDGSVGEGIQPLMLDFRFSNLCGFSCRTCGPCDSTGWATDAAELLGDRNNLPGFQRLGVDAAWAVTEPRLGKLRRLYILGGEPLMERDHYLFLERLIAAGATRIPIRYNTNLSVLGIGKWDVLDLWRRFADVHLDIGLDGHGPAGELVRSGFKQAKFMANFNSLRERCPEVRHRAYVTVSALNVFHLPEAIAGWIRDGVIGSGGGFKVNLVEKPAHYDIRILNSVEKSSVRQSYLHFLEALSGQVPAEVFHRVAGELRAVLGWMTGSEGTPDRRAVFRQVTLRLDRIRGERAAAVLPGVFEIVYGCHD